MSAFGASLSFGRVPTEDGIASGTVVVGDLEGAGHRQTGAIAGETPNLAARLEALAAPDQVVISGLTRQLIGTAIASINPSPTANRLGPTFILTSAGYGGPPATKCSLSPSRAFEQLPAMPRTLTF